VRLRRETVREAADAWLAPAKSGAIRTRSGRRYKPSVLRSYEIALRTKINPRLGSKRLSAITRNSLQDLIEEFVAQGYSPSSIRNAVMPLRAIFRRAVTRGEVPANQTRGLDFPVNPRARDRVASPLEARALIDALPEGDRALWARAIYAGLRRVELQALRWCDVPSKGRVIQVVPGWDREGGLIEPKSVAAKRRVPIAKALAKVLARPASSPTVHRRGLRVSATGERPFDPPTIAERARLA
jgi:integrase